MKRNNPETNMPFKRGDVRHDGYVFFNYTAKVKSDGFFMERWLSPTSSENAKNKDKSIKRAKYQRKTDRKSPGYNKLNPRQKNTVLLLQQIERDGDWPESEILEALVGNELDAGPQLEEAIRHAGQLSFNARELFRKSLSL